MLRLQNDLGTHGFTKLVEKLEMFNKKFAAYLARSDDSVVNVAVFGREGRRCVIKKVTSTTHHTAGSEGRRIRGSRKRYQSSSPGPGPTSPKRNETPRRT